MEKQLMAYSEKFGEFPVTIGISKDFNAYSVIEINGKRHRTEFRVIEQQPVVELWPSAIQALGLNKKVVFLRLRSDFREPLAEMKQVAAEMKTVEQQKRIDELLSSGNQIYTLSRGGDSYKLQIHICQPTTSENLRPEYKQLIPFNHVEIESDDLAGLDIKSGDEFIYCFNGFYGDVTPITAEQYQAILAASQARILASAEQEKAEKKASEEAKAAKFEQARQTGKPVELTRYSTDCNDASEECNTDIVTVFAMPDGSRSEKRQHTW